MANLSNILGGAFSGGAKGAAIGSVGGVPGAVIGGVGGAIAGGIESASNEQDISEYQDRVQQAILANQQAAEEAALAYEQLANGLNPENLSQYQFSVLQQYYPTVANLVLEQYPDLLSNQGQGRDAMISALQQNALMAEQGDSPAAQAQRELAYRQTTQAQQQLYDKLSQQAYQQGQGQFNMNLASQLGQQNQQNISNMALQNLANQDQIRQQALAQMGQLGGQIQANDMNAKQYNTSTLNDYNKRLATTKWDYEQQRANSLNQGDMFNINNKQNIANMNKQQQLDALNQRTNLRKGAIDMRLQAKTGANNQMLGVNQPRPSTMVNDTLDTAANAYNTYNNLEIQRQRLQQVKNNQQQIQNWQKKDVPLNSSANPNYGNQ